jgi:hypothetical protein
VVQRDVERAREIHAEFPKLYRVVRDAAWPRLRRSMA